MITRKLLCVLMSVVLVVGLMPLPAYAVSTLPADENEVASDVESVSGEPDLAAGTIAISETPLDVQDDVTASGTWGSCNWDLAADGTLTVHAGTGDNTNKGGSGYKSPWIDYASSIKKAVFEEGVVMPSICRNLFGAYGTKTFSSLTLVNMYNVDFSQATDLSFLFYECSSLKEVYFNHSGADTSNVTDMSMMFANCEALTMLGGPSLVPHAQNELNFNTSNVINMEQMFLNCKSLTILSLKSFNTANVKSMRGMFCSCESLVDLKISLSRFNTANVENMNSMFRNCFNLSWFDFSRFDTAKVKSMELMFANCYALTSLDLSSFNTANVTDMRSMLDNCTQLSSLTFGQNFGFVEADPSVPGEAVPRITGAELPEPSSAEYAEGQWCTWKYTGKWVRGSDKVKASSAELMRKSGIGLAGTWTWGTERVDKGVTDPNPAATNNAWLHEGSIPYTESSFLHVNGNVLERVEFVDGELLVEQIASDYSSVISRKAIDPATYRPSNLPEGDMCRWGGFFSGAEYNFIATGQNNLNSYDSVAVFRFTKYTKDWEYVGHVERFGANTISPYSVAHSGTTESGNSYAAPSYFPIMGSCDFAEIGNTLYVRTDHTMYYSNAYHQASASFAIDEDSMTFDRNKELLTSAGDHPAGYVSHSLSQFLTVVDGCAYALDLSDSYPAPGAVLQRLYYGSRSPDAILVRGGGRVQNGGLESSETRKTVLSVGSRPVESEGGSVGKCWDAWIGVTPHGSIASLEESTVRRMTSYDNSSAEEADTPFLVKINEDRFLVLWGVLDTTGSARNQSTGHTYSHTGKINYQFVNGLGENIGGVYTMYGVLSDCQPVVHGDNVVWYASDGGVPNFYSINAYTGAPSSVERFSEVKVQYEGQGQQYNEHTHHYEEAVSYTIAKKETGPDVTLTYADHVLEEGVNFEKSYSLDVVNKKGTITLSGKGSYDGQSRTISFDIMPAYIEDAEVTGVVDKAYDGTPQTQSGYVVTYKGETLSEGEDYTVSYNNNTKATTTVSGGTASVVFLGKGLATGYKDVRFRINPAAITEVVLEDSEMEYQLGRARKPSVVSVKAGSLDVPESGYTVSYENNQDVGTAKVIVTGKADTDKSGNYDALNNYSGTVTTEFKIVPTSMSGVHVSVSPSSYTYDGKAKEPTVTAVYSIPNTYTRQTLTPGVDYTVKYENNINVGTATVTVEGKGNYTGTQSATFEINAASVTPGKKSIEQASIILASSSCEYSGYEQRPDVQVVLDGMALTKDSDYTLAYSNNVNAGTATVTVTGKGGYEGAKSATFTIAKRAVIITAKSNSKAYDGTPLTASATGYMTSGFVASADVASVTLAGSVTNIGTAKSTVTDYKLADGVEGNYVVTTADGTLTVTAASIATATVTLSPTSYAYDGKEKTPAVTVKLGGRTLVSGTDYTVSYSNNAKVGTATTTVTGKGNYTGSKSATFVIAADSETVYRLYDTRTGEHHYTKDANERKVLLGRGNWNDEGTAWVTPKSSSTPVYRVYDLWTGEHHYTSDANEQKVLVGSGRWRDEGVAWYSDDAKTCKVFRVERHDRGPLQHHHYTINENERNVCIGSWGWNDEGIGWYALSAE